MDGRMRQHRRPSYSGQPFWLRSQWWLWTGGCISLIWVLSIGAPLLCIVHCALLDVAHVQIHALSGSVTTIMPGCIVGSPLPADQHVLLQAIFPAILATASGIAWWPIRCSSMVAGPFRLQPWVVPPSVPPPEFYS